MSAAVVPEAGERAARAGGADEPRPMRVAAVVPVARDTSLLALEPLDAGPLAAAGAGAHLDLHLPDGLVRQYSLVLDAPGFPDDRGRRYVVGVKRDPASRGGSRWLHDHAVPGAVLPAGGPRNHFPLVEDAEHTVLLAGGIGVTPIWSMMRRLEALGRPFEMHYACRSREDAVFAEDLAGRPGVRLHVDEEAGCLLDVGAICRGAPASAHLYCCGPGPMLGAFEAATAARPADRVHLESFGARLASAAEGGFEVELAASGTVLAVGPGERLIDALRAAGADVPTSCEEGVCGSCETRVVAGVPDHRCTVLSPAEREAGATMMVCCGGSRGRRLVLDL